MAKDDNRTSSLFWVPAVAGGAIGATRMVRDIRDSSPSSWFRDPTSAGRAVRDQAVSGGMLNNAIPSSAQHTDAMGEMALQGTWNRIPNARRAVAEASRASLLQAAQMPVEEIDVLSRNILAPKGYPDFFGQARQQVAKFGSPRVFMETLGRYAPSATDPFAGQAAPGIFFGQQKLYKMFNEARDVKRTANWINAPLNAAPNWYAKSLKGTEANVLGGYLKGLGPGASVKNIVQYPGGISMAHLQMRVGNMPDPLQLTVPLHSTRYRKSQAEYVMNRIYSGVPSRGGKMTTWGEHYIKQVQESLIPGIEEAATEGLTKQDLKRIMKQKTGAFETQMTRYMMWTPGIRHPGLDFMNKVNSQMIVAPDLSEMIVRNVLDKPDIDREMGLLFKEHGLYPGVSGGEIVAGRMLGGADPRNMWAYGADFPFERRPLQFAREFTPTQRALAAMDARPAAFGFSRRNPFLATAARKELIGQGVVAPELLVGYALKGGRAERVLKGSGLAAEELLLRKELMPMFETERITQMKLGLHEAVGQGKGVANWLEGATLGKIAPFPLKPGQQIGYELKTGQALFAADAPGMTQELIGAQLTMAGKGQEAAQVFVRETHTTEDFAKLFGQLKVTTRGRDAAYMSKVEKDLGIQMAKNLDAFAFADELRKNRSFLKQQMASGLGILAQKRIARMDDLVMQLKMAKRRGDTRAVEYIGNRLDAYDRAMSKTAWMEMQNYRGMSAEQVQTMLPDELAILRKGKAWGLDVRLIGGGMEEAASILPEGMLSQARGIAGRRGLVHPSGMVVGSAVSNVGAYRHTMGGGILEGGIKGSMEPRGIVGLMQHNWMAGKQNVAHMLAAENLRLMGNYSGDIDEVLKISRSMLGQEMKGLDRLTAWAAEGKARDVPVRKAGYMLDLGVPVEQFGGASSVYVPGEEAMRRFGQFRGDAGEILRTDLANKYNHLARAATRVKNLGNEAVAVNSLGLAAKELTEAVMGEAGQSMYGRGGGSRVYGALRGKRLASQFLAVSAVDELTSKAVEGVVELSERSANEMFRELQNAATTATDREFVRGQRNAFLRGETIAGQVSRHPFIGPYSIQPTLLQRATGATTKMEQFVNVPAYMDETIGVLGDARKALGKQITANLSPMLGLAADYDDDRLIVSLIGDEKTARATEDLMHGGKYMREYKKFAAESAVLKELAKQQLGAGAAPDISDLKKLILGSTKLRVGQAETAGISLGLSEAKLAMSYYKPSLAPKFNIIAEMMENQIISGKKMTEVGKQNIGRRVASAIEEIGSANAATAELDDLVNITEDMFGSQLKAGIELEAAGVGKWTMRTDPQQLWQEAQGALRQGREKGGIVTRYRQMARGRIHLADMTVGEVIQQVEGARAGKYDSLSMLAAGGPATTPRGKMGHAVSNAIRGLNQARKRLGAVSKTWYRPAMIGLAGTAAAAMLLGGPKGQPLDRPQAPASGDVNRFGPGNAQLSQSMLRGITPTERDMRPESLPIPSSIESHPTAPGMASPSTYMTNSAPLSHRVMVRATAGDFSPDYDSVVQALRPVIGDASMRVNFRDNRAKMTSQSIADMLEEA